MRNSLQKVNIEGLNLVLLLVSLLLAFVIPFRLFLVVYALLGPLHYVTELNWLVYKGLFISKGRLLFWFMVVLSAGYTLPFLMTYLNNIGVVDLIGYEEYLADLQLMMNVVVFGALILALFWRWFPNIKTGVLTLFACAVIGVVIWQSFFFIRWFGVLLPTIIHVYLFTLLFMFFGALKDGGRLGYFNVVLMVLVPFLVAAFPVDPQHYFFDDTVKTTIVDGGFHVLGAHLGGLLGVSDGKGFYFYEVIDLKIQIFISFAYTYHYLNWFLKTSVIGWSKGLKSKKGVLVLLIWLVSVLLYWLDYKLGITLVLFLSVLHVFAEFPLNILSFRKVGEFMIFGKKP